MPVETPPFRVRYAETDAQAVAYYGSYFTWWEVGELHFLETLGVRAPELDRQGILVAAAESYARFLRPAVYDDLVAVRVRLSQAAPKRALLETELVRVEDGAVLATGKMARVLIGPDGKALPMPERLLAAAEQRVERIVVSERADPLLGALPRGARECTQELRVRYAETDAQGVAYFGSYFAWFEAGRAELTRAVGLPYSVLERQGVLLPVAEAFCRYLSPLRPREVFRLSTAVPALGRVKMTFVNRLTSPDGRREVAAGYTVHGCTGRDGRPRALPPEVVERFALPKEPTP
ncbi:MAG TPA: thioesterase family protein [Planctomycetota bacterium]|nr:thioesterase family protein [Planctomycetota bacterium]HRR79850.1 thioesterase family protein [Planctomycetota bacterium]HRT92926.1 thioesterase family protein [Planctomycetota bacterium]